MKRAISAVLYTAALGALCLLGVTQVEAGATRTMQVDLSGRAMEKAHPAARRNAERKRSRMPAVRLEGELQSNSRGLFVGRSLVEITASTSIFPRVRADRMPDPESFNGRHVTVFGRQTADGVEATVLILGAERAATSRDRAELDEYTVEVTRTTGRLRSDVPR